MYRNYFKTAWRNLVKSKVFSLINIAGLAIGLTCCMLIVLYNKDDASFDQFHKNKNELYSVIATITGDKGTHKLGITNSPVGPAFKDGIPAIKAFVRLQSENYIVQKGTETFNQEAVHADTNFFAVFSFPLLEGDAATVLKDPNSLVLTQEMAIKYFGTPHAIGKILNFKNDDKFEPRTVTGIAKNVPQNSSIKFEMLVPFTDNGKEWMGFYLNTYILLDNKADYKAVAAKFDDIFLAKAQAELGEAKEKYGFKDKVHFGLFPFTATHLDVEYDHGVRNSSNPVYAYILSGIAIFILVIACINFINLKLAQSLQRSKEIGVRKVMGGQRGQLVKQFLGESFLLSLFAFLLAIAITAFVLPLFNELANKQLSFSTLLDGKLVMAYLILFLITGLAAGLYPAWVLSNYNPLQTLYNRQRFTGKNYLTKGLIIFQFALATFLIITTVVMYTQFNFLTHTDIGYNDKDIVLLKLERGTNDRVINTFKNELANSPLIKMVAATDGNGNETGAKIDGKEIAFAYKRMDENYLPELQIPLTQGRNFSTSFPSDTSTSVIVNETFAKQAGWTNAIGKQVDFFWANKKLTVVGVVKDYHFEGLQTKIKPLLFVSDPNYPIGQLVIKLNPGNIAGAMKLIATTFKKVVPLQPYSYNFMNTINQDNYREEAKWKQIITFSAALSVFICCIGLFGLSMLATQKRTKEIGIRKVLGANIQSLVTLLSVNFVLLILIAFIIAAPVAWYVNNQWLQNFPYRTGLSWSVFTVAGLGMVGLAFATIGYQSIKAALMNPVTSLKAE